MKKNCCYFCYFLLACCVTLRMLLEDDLSKSLGPWQPVRYCFHPGTSSIAREPLGNINAPEVTANDMLRAMMAYIWPKEDPLVRKR